MCTFSSSVLPCSLRRHLFAYKLTTKQNKDHNWNVKSNWKCHISSLALIPMPSPYLYFRCFLSMFCVWLCVCVLPGCRSSIRLVSLYQLSCRRLLFGICIHVSRYHCQMYRNGCTVTFHCIRHTSIFDPFRVPLLLFSQSTILIQALAFVSLLPISVRRIRYI